MQKTYLFLLQKKRRLDRIKRTKKIAAVTRPLGIGFLAVLLILLAGGLLAAGILYASITADLPSLEVLPVLLSPVDGELLQPTRITDSSGETVLLTLENPGIERRYMTVNPETPAHFSPQLLRAVVSALEPDFWESPGYSLKDWRDPEPATIAERLAGELLLWDEPASIMRAVRMRLLAAQLVTKYGRTQVLEWYLNSAWFGHLAVGAESASQLYFDKSCGDLDLAESAMLVSAIQAPALNPLDAPLNALEMQRELLAEMAQSQAINIDEFTEAIHEEINLREDMDDPLSQAPAFTRHLLQSLESRFFENRLQRGGLVIQSSLDLDLQQQLICTAVTQMDRLQGQNGSSESLDSEACPTALLLPTQQFNALAYNSIAGAGIVIDPQKGSVLAYMDPTASNGSHLADSGYQPGSLLSPFIALSGFARGLSPASLEWDIPNDNGVIEAGYKNVDQQWHGAVSVRSAVANNYLVPMVDVLNQAGISNTWRLASTLGLSSLNDAGETVSPLFGGSSASLLEIASAYGTLANSGVRSGTLNVQTGEITLNFISEIKTTTGRVLAEGEAPDNSAVLSLQLAYLINHVLSDESARWESLGYPNVLEIGQTTAAKLGGVADGGQVWTVGYTPQRLVLVWMGNAQQEENAQQLDPLMTAGIWHAMMREATSGLSNSGWMQPDGITTVDVCVPSGMLPSADCPSTMAEVFLTGNEPTLRDTLYQMIKINRETGQRATVFTDPALIEEKLFLNIPARARQWAVEAGLAVVPSGYDAIPASQMSQDMQITSPSLFAPVAGKVAILGTVNLKDLASWTVQIGEGINPPTWLQIGEGYKTVSSGGKLAEWDTSSLDGLYAVRLTAIGQDQSVQTAVIQVTVDNVPPQIKITYPEDGQEVQPVRGSITLLAEVEDNAGISSVDWVLDGKTVSTQTEAPWLYLMPEVPGKHTLQVTVYDNAGNETASEQVEFTVSND